MTAANASNPWPDLHDAADRVWTAARVYKAHKSDIILLSGGEDEKAGFEPESNAMRDFLLDLGVPENAIIEESHGRTTRENAFFSSRILTVHGIRQILLVTSASHMHRSKAIFEETGLDVFPVATDYAGPVPSGLQAWLPNATALDETGRTMKEWAGRWMR